ncbi:MAG: methyltransferase domain-containing protein [Bacteroidales bacterium]|nr:methyltransferase domain-containing protein [Bacteroidales bacterium]
MMMNPWTDQEVEAHWDSVSEIYVTENEKVKETHDQRFRESITHLELRSGMKILNITSRDAEATDYINRAMPEVKVINAEISFGLMGVAEKLRPSVTQVKLETYSSLPFNDGEFDGVLSLETLEHVSEPLRFLQELHRVSTDDARLVLSCPPATSELPYRVYTAFFGGHGEGPHRFLSSKEVKKMLKETKWNLLAHKGTILIPVGPGWLQKLGEKIIDRMQGTFIAELGIRQFYVCEKA